MFPPRTSAPPSYTPPLYVAAYGAQGGGSARGGSGQMALTPQGTLVAGSGGFAATFAGATTWPPAPNAAAEIRAAITGAISNSHDPLGASIHEIDAQCRGFNLMDIKSADVPTRRAQQTVSAERSADRPLRMCDGVCAAAAGGSSFAWALTVGTRRA